MTDRLNRGSGGFRALPAADDSALALDSTVRSPPRRAGRDVDGFDSTRLDDAEEDPRACHVSRAERDGVGESARASRGKGCPPD